MLGIGDKLPEFEAVGVKPRFMNHEENGESAFEVITQDSFPGKWKVFFFYPKDFTFVCPTEVVEFANVNQEFAHRDCLVLGGSTDTLAALRLAKQLLHLADDLGSGSRGFRATQLPQ